MYLNQQNSILCILFPLCPSHLTTHPLPSFPPHAPNPLRKRSDILPLQQPLHGKPLFSQLLIRRNPMHKTMARATQPRNIVQFILGMPSPLNRFRMRLFRDQMMVGEWNPIPLTDLAVRCVGFSGRGQRGWG